eukprot:2245683-Pyramimonas_sp.AAC.1
MRPGRGNRPRKTPETSARTRAPGASADLGVEDPSQPENRKALRVTAGMKAATLNAKSIRQTHRWDKRGATQREEQLRFAPGFY